MNPSPRSLSRALRIVPLTTTMLALVLLVKLNELVVDSRSLRELYGVREASASDTPAAGEDKKTPPKDEAKDSGKKEEPAASDAAKKDAAADKPDTGSKDGEHKAEDGKEGDGKEGGEGHASAKPPEEPRTFGTGKSTIKEIEERKAKDATARFTQSEINVLENLAKRRDELEAREHDLELKAKVLEATEHRINDRISEMKTLESQLSKVVAQYNEKQNAQIKSLVKIYEAMKPADAAHIFNELDMPILLEVIDKMGERKVALVLALMDPRKARDVTQELAAMRKSGPNTAAAGPTP